MAGEPELELEHFCRILPQRHSNLCCHDSIPLLVLVLSCRVFPPGTGMPIKYTDTYLDFDYKIGSSDHPEIIPRSQKYLTTYG